MRIDEQTLTILSRSNVVGHNLYLPDQLDRKAYLAVDKALQACGGRWSRKDRAHVFEGTADDAIEQMILTGEVVTDRDLSFFRTMGLALDKLIEAAALGPDMDVIEPSAGRGDIVIGCLAAGVRSVTAIEIDERRFNGLMQIDAPPGARLLPIQGDFMRCQFTEAFDRAVMNPPFTVPGDRRADLAHVARALTLVKPGGRLAAVMSGGITFREDKKTLDFLRTCKAAGKVTVTPLPPGAFSDAGTEVNTAILVVDVR
jgi:predicted RNA methylase